MTFSEISAAIKANEEEKRWQAMLAYINGELHGAALSTAFGKGKFPGIKEIFPKMFDDIPDPEQEQPWQTWKERVLDHAHDFERRRQA